MTTITTTCAGCGRVLAVPDRYLDRDLKCPHCGSPFRLGAEVATPSPEPAPVAPPTVEAVAPATVPPALGAPFGEESPEAAGTEAATKVEAGAVFWRVRRLGVLSTALTSGAIHAGLGFLIGIAAAVVSFTRAAAALPFLRGPLAGALAVLALPLLYGAVGFLFGAALALVYNLAARLTGGIKVLLE